MSSSFPPTSNVSTARFMLETGLAADFARVAEPVLEGMGFRLVRVLVSGNVERVVQIMAERSDGSMTVDDCEEISKGLSPVLDVEDPLSGKYRLEISSPGIDRPLVRPSDFEDWSGHEAKIETKEPVDGRKRFKGALEGFEDGEVRIAAEAGKLGIQHLGFPISLIADAKLVLTDDLIREALTRAKQRHSGAPGDMLAGDGAELDENDLEKPAKKYAPKPKGVAKHKNAPKLKGASKSQGSED
jgi:ribosome maturation factor RimP